MKPIIRFADWGTIRYGEAWAAQEKIFNEAITNKLNKEPTTSTLVFAEHPHVYTLGKSGDAENLLISGNTLQSIGAEYFRVNRGGDITYHGPGQIVGYPILDLEVFRLSYRGYIEKLEETIIRFLREAYLLETFRSEGATGVWLGQGPGLRKICAIGTRGSRHITMHGFALNVNTDLSYFRHINPCGFTNRDVTSIQAETGAAIPLEEAKARLLSTFAEVFGAEISR